MSWLEPGDLSLPKLTLNSSTPSRFEEWRQAISPAFDLEAPDPASFDCGMASWQYGSVVLGQFWSSEASFIRNNRTVAASGFDHYLIQLIQQGVSHLVEGAAQSVGRPGAVRILDMTRTVETAEPEAFSNLTLVIPRPMLEPLVASPVGLHGLNLEPGTTGAILLGQMIRTMAERADTLAVSEGAALGPAAAMLVAACFGPAADMVQPAREARRNALRRMIETYIARNIGSSQLSGDLICRRFGLSRASLYRLFQPLGGVGAYIRSRRLDEAYRLLANGPGRERIDQLASDLGFANAASFSRDFRARFGATPSAVRARETFLAPPSAAIGETFVGWVHQLR